MFLVIHETQNTERTGGDIQIFFHVLSVSKGKPGRADLGGEFFGFKGFITGHHQQVEAGTLPVAQQSAGEYEFVLVDELAAKDLKNITLADTTLYVAEGDLAVHKVAPDETLTRIAREYYGDKRLWPYIVKYNKMSNPNGLCRGMEIAIPRLTPKK